jgi:diguanylate cyclase (GGDEF)-like protein
MSRDEAVGSFAVAARRPRAFGKDKREMLTVVATHVAVKLTNAQLYGRMEEMATTDGLTGLVNHRTFQERFAEMLARAERTGGKHALLLTDIDHFKKVNDTWGHATGDAVIQYVANTLAQSVKGQDCVARYGGEEFAVILPATSMDAAMHVGENIRTALARRLFVPRQLDETVGAVTVSIGVACYEPGEALAEWIKRADAALYQAKKTGRDRVVSA